MASAHRIGRQSGEQTDVCVGTVRPLQGLAANPLQSEARAQHRSASCQILGWQCDFQTSKALAEQRVIGYGFECSFQRLGWKRSTPAQVADSTLRGADGQSNVSHGICSDWI